MLKQELETYLENWKDTRSTQLDSAFGLFGSDVTSLARAYRKGELYIFTFTEFLEDRQQMIDEAKEYAGDDEEELQEIEETLVAELEDIKNRYADTCLFVEEHGRDDFKVVW